MNAHGPTADHPRSDRIADFINGRLLPESRATLESHLAECRTCRQQVVSARRLLDTYQDHTRRPLKWALPGIAVAIALVVFIPRRPARPLATETLRGQVGSAAEGPLRLAIIAPVEGATTTAKGVTFVWHRQAGQPLFRVTLNDGARKLWSVSTVDTSARLPDSVSLAPAKTYSWYVDAVDPDGRALSSGTQLFQVHR